MHKPCPSHPSRHMHIQPCAQRGLTMYVICSECIASAGSCTVVHHLPRCALQVSFEPNRTGPRDMISAVEAAGFGAALLDADDGGLGQKSEDHYW